MQKLELLKSLLSTKTLFKQQRFVQTSFKALDDSRKKQAIQYEEYEEPFKQVNIKGLQDVGILKPGWSWPKYNRIIYPPDSGVSKVTPFVHHMRPFIKYSPKKMWLTASMVFMTDQFEFEAFLKDLSQDKSTN
jgi:hypothetical protein